MRGEETEVEHYLRRLLDYLRMDIERGFITEKSSPVFIAYRDYKDVVAAQESGLLQANNVFNRDCGAVGSTKASQAAEKIDSTLFDSHEMRS
jgi:hypothetical protein